MSPAQKAARKKRQKEYMTIFINGKQKRVKRPATIDGMDADEFIRRNADPIWLHQNQMWEYIDKTEDQVLSREQISITREVNYIILQAQENSSRVVTLGSLVLFSTDTGDAWILDPGDGLALCLVRDGENQSFEITDTTASVAIGWNAHYRIAQNAFIVINQSGQIRTIFGYPTREISRAAARVH